MTYLVELQTRDIGVRMALGARASTILSAVAAEGLRIAVVGCALGTAAAAALAVINRSRMYGAATIDPVAFGGAITVLLATMLLASIVPAARAARIDPAVALRAD